MQQFQSRNYSEDTLPIIQGKNTELFTTVSFLIAQFWKQPEQESGGINYGSSSKWMYSLKTTKKEEDIYELSDF